MLDLITGPIVEEVHGQRINVYLDNTAVNISALSRQTGLQYSSLSKFLSGKLMPRATFIRKVATALNMSMEELLDSIDARNIRRAS